MTTTLITGANKGLGFETARRLVAEGHTVYLGSRDAERGRRAAERLGTRLVLIDVTDNASVTAAARAVEADGGLDVLVNNAAMTTGNSLWDLSMDEWDDVLDTNLRSVFVLSRAAGAHMRERGSGRIVNLASLAGQTARPSGAAYSASKAGILALTRVFALELAPHGITVNAIAPGVTETPMVKAVAPEVLERLIADIPVGRICRPEEIAGLVSFLISERAAFITGATYDVNGGVLMR